MSAAASPVNLTLVTIGGSVGVCVLGRMARRDWFHPFLFPFGYVALTLLAPLTYLVIGHQSIGVLAPSEGSLGLTAAFTLTLAGLASGTGLGMAVTSSLQTRRMQRRVDNSNLLFLGRLALAVTIPLRLYEIATHIGQPYGQGSAVDFGPDKALAAASVMLLLVGVILVVVANTQLRDTIATRSDFGLFALVAVPTLLSGSRGDLVAPVVFALWAHNTYVRRIHLGTGFVVAVVIVFLFQGVSGSRSGAAFYEGPQQAVARTLSTIGVPAFTTARTIEHVPTDQPFLHGTTYLSAIERQLPSFVATPLLGPPTDTGTFVFRRVIHFNSPNAGFAYSLPAEGYLNWGFLGVFGVAALGGVLLGYSYKKQGSPPTRALHLLYPVIVASLPGSLRSDAVAQIKLVFYPMVILATAYAIARIADARDVSPSSPKRVHTPNTAASGAISPGLET